MKKRISMGLFIGFIILVLAGCAKESDPSKEVKEIDMTQTSSETTSSVSSGKTEWEKRKINKEETFDDIEFIINDVSLSTNAHKKDKTGTKTMSAIEVELTIKNKSKTKTYTTYPDQAQLTTSLGDVLFKADKTEGDVLGGKLNKGESKKGTLIWYTANQSIQQAKWINLKWMSSYDDPAKKTDNEKRKAHNVRISLP